MTGAGEDRSPQGSVPNADAAETGAESSTGDSGVVGSVPSSEEEGAETDARIAELTRELAAAIKDSGQSDKDVMRDYAIDLLRDEVETGLPPGGAVGEGAEERPRTPGTTPVAFAIPVFVVGVILGPLFPPIGMLLLLLGVVLCVVGLGTAAFRALSSRWSSGGGAGADGAEHPDRPEGRASSRR